jgi:enamine deaminase RidA (YjgF/YER057c/UK114 family)
MTKQSLLPLDIGPSLPGGRSATPVAGAVRTGSRVFLSACNAVRHDGTTAGLGDPAAQAHAALDGIEAALQAAGGSLADVTRLTTSLVDRAHRKPVYEAIGQRLRDVYPVSTGLIVAGLPLPELVVQIDAEAVIGAKVTRHRTFALKQWFGQDIAWQGAMVAATDAELFIRGQTGSSFDGRTMAGTGRRPDDAAAQVDLALTNLATLLRECGSDLDEICKITVYINDRGYRSAVYPVIGQHLAGVRPVSTGLIVNGFARPEILFELDAQVIRKQGGPHARIRPYHSNLAHYGLAHQNLGCEFCMAVRAGEHIRLRGQTGVDLNERMHGIGDAAAQAEQAMENVATLLGDAGVSMEDVTKAMVFVTDRAFLVPVTERVLRRLAPATPAFSAVVVKGLASPELLMEVDISAVIPGGIA